VIDFECFRRIADMVGARLLVDIAHIAGLVAVGLHPSPVPYADVVTSTTHKTLRGPRSAFILCRSELAGAIDAAVFPEMQGGPFMHTIAAKAVCFHEAMQPAFLEYQRSILDNAQVLAAELRGHGFRLLTAGTDNHLVMIDLTDQGITGKEAEQLLGEVGMVVNREPVPFDTRPPRVTSGIRLGTPAVTTRGFGPEEMKQIAALMARLLAAPNDRSVREGVAREVRQICSRFPVPGIDE